MFVQGRPEYISGRDAYVLEANSGLRPQEFVTAARVLNERGQKRAAGKILDDYLTEVAEAVRGWLVGSSRSGQLLLMWTMQGRLAGFANYLQEYGLDQHAARFRKQAAHYQALYQKILEGR